MAYYFGQVLGYEFNKNGGPRYKDEDELLGKTATFLGFKSTKNYLDAYVSEPGSITKRLVKKGLINVELQLS